MWAEDPSYSQIIWSQNHLVLGSKLSCSRAATGKLRVNTGDILNCAYVALGNALEKCRDYRVGSHQKAKVTEQIEELNALRGAKNSESKYQYVGLFCPSEYNSYLAYLPEPNYYQLQLGTQGTVDRYQENLKNDFSTAENISQSDRYHDVPTIRNVRYQEYIEGTSGTKDTSLEPNGRETWRDVPNLPEKYKYLDYRGGMVFFNKLPRKADGSIHKTKAYNEVFKVSNRSLRKPLSEFMDLLEQEFGF